MPRYEYKVVPAPAKGQKARGVKTPEGRFALSVQTILNEMGADGWEYLRAELLPSEERSGLTGSTTNWRNVLIFRRPQDQETEAFQPRILDTALPAVGAAVVPAPSVGSPEPASPPRLGNGASRIPGDGATTDAAIPDADPGTDPEDEFIEAKDDVDPDQREDEGIDSDAPEAETQTWASQDESDALSGFDKAMRNTKSSSDET